MYRICVSPIFTANLPAALTLTLDPAAAGPVKFAAEEIRREAAIRGLTVVNADATAPADVIRITLAVGAPAGMNTPSTV